MVIEGASDLIEARIRLVLALGRVVGVNWRNGAAGNVGVMDSGHVGCTEGGIEVVGECSQPSKHFRKPKSTTMAMTTWPLHSAYMYPITGPENPPSANPEGLIRTGQGVC